MDEVFDASNLEYEVDDENPDELLIRIELVEFIMRIAQIQTKRIAKLTNQDLEKLHVSSQVSQFLRNYIIPYTDYLDRLSEFRDQKLIFMKDI